MLDWGIGKYEAAALELEPAARHVVRAANLAPGEHVLDVACGTGNAALLAARAGAVVTGLDGAERLIEVARSRAAAEGLEASFVVGDAQELKFDDGSFDVALSVFGVIFAFDAEKAFSVPGVRVADPKACQCGEVLKGVIKPFECKVFGSACTPERPIGTSASNGAARSGFASPPRRRRTPIGASRTQDGPERP